MKLKLLRFFLALALGLATSSSFAARNTAMDRHDDQSSGHSRVKNDKKKVTQNEKSKMTERKRISVRIPHFERN